MEELNLLIFLPSLFGGVFAFLGVAFFLIGFSTSSRSKSWHKTTGTITNEKSIFKNIPSRYPSAKYIVSGVEYTHTSNMRQSPGIPNGKQVEILYNPDNPSNARINTFVQNGTFFKIFGIVFFIIGFLVLSLLLFLYLILS